MTQKRRPSIRVQVQKALYALSSNQCAHPECTTRLFQKASPDSGGDVIGEICHIHALSPAGPRGDSQLTDKELNSQSNLILLCPTHHAMVDGQPNVYTAAVLKRWKATHESKLFSDTEGPLTQSLFSPAPHPTALIDQHIDKDIQLSRKRRFHYGFDTAQSALTIARKLTNGDYSTGTADKRGRALAWCVRFLSNGDQLRKAQEYLQASIALSSSAETQIASAFVTSRNGDRAGAMRILADIDTPMSRTAAFLIVEYHDGAQQAVDWLQAASVAVTDLDTEGKCFLLGRYLHLADWPNARQVLEFVSDEDLHERPFLHYLKALTYLVTAVPEELGRSTIDALPFAARAFPLAEDQVALEARRTARYHFAEAARIARQLRCNLMATIADEYSLWLELKDPEQANEGQRRLEALLREPRPALRLVHLGLEFGLDLDIPEIERTIEREIAINGGLTFDVAIARFSLVRTRRTPAAVAEYLTQHFEDLSQHLHRKAMRFVQIEAMAKANLTGQARDLVAIARAEGLTELEESRLRRILSETEGADAVQSRQEQYQKTGALSDLALLVQELESENSWSSLCQYGTVLFQKTRALEDAERLATALHNTNNICRLLKFFEDNRSLLLRSDLLRLLHAWVLYRNGALLEARTALTAVNRQKDRNYRNLELGLAIAMGDWNRLSALVADEWTNHEDRTAEDLMAAAQLALHLDLQSARDLTVAASRAAGADAAVLTAAYFLACSAGWEDDPLCGQWLRRAIELSGDQGPLRPIGLQELVDRKPEWDRHEVEISDQLGRGEVPMFIAAHATNRSLVRLMLVPALNNRPEADPRHRTPIFAYSGCSQPMCLAGAGYRSVGMDATAILTLALLDLLPQALDLFDVVHLPHSTLSWLLQEKREVTYHQPSRIRQARRLRDLLATDQIRKFIPSIAADRNLSAETGEELASFLTTAARCGRDDEQHLVVRPSPVFRTSSLMKERANLKAYEAALTSCQAVVDKLRELGRLTATEVKQATAYLRLQEEPWPNQPPVAPNAILYLDELAIDHFLHLRLLERISSSSFRVLVSERAVAETTGFLSYEATAATASNVLDGIRRTLNRGVEARKIQISRQQVFGDGTERPLADHPTLGIGPLVERCDAIVVDDRFFNGPASLRVEKGEARLFTTLDVLDLLLENSVLTTEDGLDCKTRLRQAGYMFVPIRRGELFEYLTDCTVKDGSVLESAELRAIRENLSCVRMRACLQLPLEGAWFDGILSTFMLALKDLWADESDFAATRTRSNWIVDQIDVRKWAHIFGGRAAEVATAGWAAQLVGVAVPPFGASEKVRGEYQRWFDEEHLQTVRDRYPDVYSVVLERHKLAVDAVAGGDLSGGTENDG